MDNDNWRLLGFIPAILFAAETITLFMRRRLAYASGEPPRLQIWIQDMFVLSAAFAAAMAWQFNGKNWQTAVYPVLSVLLGFSACVDAGSSLKRVSPLRRAALFCVIMASFVLWILPSVVLWFLWKRIKAFQDRQPYADVTVRNVAVIAVTIHAVAFYLPMRSSNDGMNGYHAYHLTFAFTTPAFYWFANPCFWIATAFLLQGHRHMAAAMGFFAAGVALFASYEDRFKIWNSPAYGTWFGSMVLLGILALAVPSRRAPNDLTSAKGCEGHQ